MESSRFLIAVLIKFLLLSEIKGATLSSYEQFQLNDNINSQESQDLLQRLEKELEHHAGKEKRCSIFKAPNLQSTLDLKLKLEEQKRTSLCKFCNKLESRKNLEICKKCFNNTFNLDDDIILGSPKKLETPNNEQKNSNETNIKFENKLNSNKNVEEKHENVKETNKTQKINDDIAARNSLEINSNIRKSDVSALIKSASSRGSLETLKTQTITGNRNMDDMKTKILELKENNSMKPVRETTLSGHSSNSDDFYNNHADLNVNLENPNFHHSEIDQKNLINRRLKRKKQLRKSEETTQDNKDIEFLKKQKSDLLNEALIENSSKIFDVASDETFEDFDDFVELIKDITTTEAPKRKILPGLKISELRMRLANLRAKQNKKQPKIEEKIVTTTELATTIYKTKDPKVRLNLKQKNQISSDLETLNTENDKNEGDLLDEMKQKRSDIPTGPKKIDNEILELEDNINKKLDEILQILSHNSNKQSISKEDMKIKLKNILTKNDHSEQEEGNLQLPLLEEEIQTEDPSKEYFNLQEDILERIPTNHLIKNLLNPTTESNEAKEDKKSKLLMKLNIPLNTAFQNQLINKKYLKHSQSNDISEITTPQINYLSQENSNSESNNSEELYDDNDLLDLLQNAEPTAFEPKIISTRSTNTFKNIKPTYLYSTTEKTLLEKENKMLSLHRSKLNELRNKIHARRQQNLFEKNINMKPEIDDEKYKNFQLTLRNNETKNTGAKTLDDSKLNLEQLLNEHLNSQERQETLLTIPKMLRFTENKINLPLILMQNEDGSIEIVLDKSELCSQLNGGKCPYGEKSLCKRKTEENLTKYPSNIFNILKDINSPTDDKTKENFYKNIINQKLFELFKSLNIDIDNSQELHSYIDDMPNKQKTELKQYLLNSLSNSQTDSNNINKDFSKKYQSSTENNRLYFKINSEDKITPKKNFLSDIFKNLIHNQIQKELVNTNVCPSCKKNQCFCKNLDKVFFPPDYSAENSNSESSRILGKRQNDNIVTEDSDNSSDISPHGTVKRRYKIVHNILDWVHDVMVHNNTII